MPTTPLPDAGVDERALAHAARTSRRTAALAGLLFLVATAAFFTADVLITGVLAGADYLTGASAHTTALTATALLAFVCGLAVVGIAVLLYPLLKRVSEPLALGYVALRAAELAAILVYLAVPLLVVELGDALLRGDVQASAAQTLGSLFRAGHEVALVSVILFTGAAGTVFTVLLYRSRLVPRWIAALGIIGYPVMLVAAVLYRFELIAQLQGPGSIAAVPVGLFELILPIWLLARGFTAPAPAGSHEGGA